VETLKQSYLKKQKLQKQKRRQEGTLKTWGFIPNVIQKLGFQLTISSSLSLGCIHGSCTEAVNKVIKKSFILRLLLKITEL
jgi:hypothetical protein